MKSRKNKSRKTNGTSITKLLSAALAAHNKNDLNRAESLYEEILAADPHQPDALHYLGVLAYQRGNSKLAYELINQAISQAPLLAAMWSNLASVASALGKNEECLKYRLKAVTLDPKNTHFQFALANEYLNKDKWLEAESILTQLNQSHPKWVAVLINLANCKKNLGKLDESGNLYDLALKIDPDIPELHANLVGYYSECGEQERALMHGKKAVELSPQNASFRFNLGNGYWALGRWGEAAIEYARALEINPNFLKARMNLGTALLIAGDYERSLDQFKLAYEIDPNQSQIYTNVGYIMKELRRNDEAIMYLKKALLLDPNDAGAWVALGSTYNNLGQFEEAKISVTNALNIMPNNGVAWLELATIELNLNNLNNSKFAILKAIDGSENKGLYAAGQNQTIDALLQMADLLTLNDALPEAQNYFNCAVEKIKIKNRYSQQKHFQKINKKIVLLRPIGRAGSLFLHSLIDGHHQVSTIPGVMLKGYFGNNVWEGIQPNFSDRDWRQTLIGRFLNVYAPLFDASCANPIPGNPLGRSIHVGEAMGLTKMGPERNQALRLDTSKFSYLLLKKLETFDEIKAHKFFELIHETWDAALNWPEFKPLIFFHIHNPNPFEFAQCASGFSHIQSLSIVREPLQGLESWLSELQSTNINVEAMMQNYTDSINRIYMFINSAISITNTIYNSRTIRLEDLKRNTQQSLENLTKWMGIDRDQCLLSPSFAGLEYEAPSTIAVRGFETTNLDRKSGYYFSEYDQRVLSILLYPISVKYGYRPSDINYLKSEIIWLKENLARPLDFEYEIQRKIKLLNPEQIFFGPRRKFESLACRCIETLERTGTYPSMASLL